MTPFSSTNKTANDEWAMRHPPDAPTRRTITMTTIAFIGLGHMGLPMARNLLKAGFNLQVFDLVQRAMDELAAEGAQAASSALEAVQGAQVVISMLPASRHVEGLYLGADGLLAAFKPGTLVLECSTIAPEVARSVHAAAHERGIELLDAPVSGGTAGAAAGTLTFMIGGPAATLTKAQPFFQAMGKNIFHAGPEGAGQVAKVCNNQVLAVQMIATAEAMAMGVANGLEPAVLAEIMRQSSGGNWTLEKYNPWPGVMENAPASKGYSGGFMAELMAKDLGLAQQAAQSSGSSTPMGALALQLYRLLLKQGKGKQDFSVVQQLFVE
jgi:L-serine 3-dehydrogenase (NAD+)